ncbi:minor histocompatibility protein HA-1-like protein [Dinothrombium tinctorium]|uniref:Minor histocompatibility protein HA-1-like protein n=1 Tax=Dinothrombium tinctorium TaxID=1965070 RepID=A0A443RHU4_9ACAR|nr:minor histocompatibility protein HA-1-like protein [Dinothrombium tinctorium]
MLKKNSGYDCALASNVLSSESGINVSLSPSMVSINSNHSSSGTSSSVVDSGGSLVEQEDIITLTNYVKQFREVLSKLRRLFSSPDEAKRDNKRETLRVRVHERLGDVLKILRIIFQKYADIQSTELLMAAGTLIQQVKGYNYEDEKADPSEFLVAIDQLAYAFSNRVSEYLMGDIDANVKSRFSEENLTENVDESSLTPNECDNRFFRLPEGIDLALHRAKVWSKYAKDVITYIEKRTHLEAEHARNLIKLAQTMKPILKEERYLPFQSIYCMALDQDLENSNACLANCAIILGHKFIEPLAARRNEHEKCRKAIKQEWQREVKKTHEAVNNLRKAKALYNQRQQEYARAKDALKSAEIGNDGVVDQNKIERKKRLEDEASAKAMEAEANYRAAIQEANERTANLEKVKKKLLIRIRELIYQCDQTMKAVTVGYYQLQHTITASGPVQFQGLCESSRLYEPGSQYIEFVKRIPQPETVKTTPSYIFEAFVESESEGRQRSVSDEESVGSAEEDHRTSGKELLGQSISSGDELEAEFNTDSGYGSTKKSPSFTKAAQTHHFRKLKSPSRCRECDTYVCFQGTECSQNLTILCGHKRLSRKMTTFGVDLSAQGKDVPDIVVKCITEIDKKGAGIKGLYRVSGVKSRVEKLCQSFENGADLVDLSDQHPNVIANVLKLYLRQLPEPLLTFRLYPDFIRIAKEYPASLKHEDTTDSVEERQIIEELKKTVSKLPTVHRKTLSYLIHHLKRISENSENNMPPSNLGIVFGPTLLRTSEGGASLSSLIDTVHQTRVIELLIMYASQVFGPSPFESEEVSDNIACKVSRDTKQETREESRQESKQEMTLLRGGKHVDFSSIKESTATHGYTSQTVITLSGQKVVTSSAATTQSKPSLHELRRQFFTAPCSPPQLRSLPSTLPIISSTTSDSLSPLSGSSQQLQHTSMKRTSSSQLSSPEHNASQEMRSSSSSQSIRLVDADDDQQTKYV